MSRLSGFDAAMLSFETLAGPLTTGSLWKLDWSTAPGGYSFDGFRERLSERLPALPEFRMKLADSVLNLDTPVWVDDPDFDLDHHVHRVQLSAPGTHDELMELLGRLLVQQMDRSRPLWDIWVIEGLSPGEDFGGVAVMHRFHHALVDGDSALDIFSRLCSTEADPPPPQHRDGVGTVTKRQIVLRGFIRFACRPWYLLTTLLPMVLKNVIETARLAAADKSASGPLRVPRTLLTGDVSERRGVAYSQLDLADVTTVKNRFGGTINDVVLAVVSGALRRFLLDRAALPTSTLIAGLPVSIQSNRGGRNNLSGTRCPLYTNLADPVDRLKAITAASSVAKERNSAISPTLMLDLCEFAPGLLTLGMRVYRWTGLSNRRPIYNLSISNVRPPQEQYYLSGAAVRARFPMGAVFNGAGLAIIVNSLNGKVNFGLVSCGEMLPHLDLGDLADGLHVALTELLDRVD
ncbi:WS/DGAT/MGAT family O-acyltransferase [Mycobacterium sp.]|uniref:WS/DGAT/MGAT family O-acyltransferase n=1 Tax=Mycobacterium sp. TaxID=1785 RepID=UPI002D9D64DD|nr:wax ester/triacylglycerol synthase family O-acyltransferase [Mycobacterium sp.]